MQSHPPGNTMPQRQFETTGIFRQTPFNLNQKLVGIRIDQSNGSRTRVESTHHLVNDSFQRDHRILGIPCQRTNPVKGIQRPSILCLSLSFLRTH